MILISSLDILMCNVAASYNAANEYPHHISSLKRNTKQRDVNLVVLGDMP